MATVAELITRLGFSVDMTGLDRYRRANERMGMFALNYWSRIGQKVFAGFLSEAVMQFGKLEQQLQAVKAVSEDLTPKGMEELKNMAQELSTKSKYSSIQIAEGMQVLAKAGLNVQGVKSAIEVVNDLSIAADMSQEKASEFMVSVMNTFGRDLQSKASWAKTANTLAIGANESAIAMKDMVYSFKYAGPAAKAFGVDVEEVTKMLALMGDAGIKGSTAGTTLRATFLRLAKQPKEARKELEKYGISISDSTGKIKPLMKILDEVKVKLKGVSQQERLAAISRIFNTTATSGIMALMNSEIKRRDELDGKIRSNTNALQYMKDEMNKGVIPSTQRLKNSWGAFLQTIGQSLAPIVAYVSDYLNEILNSFRALNPYLQELIIIITTLSIGVTTLLAVFSGWVLIKPALIAIRTELLLIQMATLKTVAMWLIIPTALALIFNDLYTYFAGGESVVGELAAQIPVFKVALDRLGESVKYVFSWLVENKFTIFGIFEMLILTIMDLGKYFYKFIMVPFIVILSVIMNGIFDIVTLIHSIRDIFVSVFTGLLSAIPIIWQGLWDGLYSIVTNIINAIVTLITTSIPNAIKNAFNGLKDIMSKIGGFFFGGEAQAAGFNPSLNPLPSTALAGGGSNTFNNQNIVNVAGTNATPSQIKNAVVSGNNQNVRTQLASVSRNNVKVLR